MVSNRRANDPSTDGKLVGECQVSETAANKRKKVLQPMHSVRVIPRFVLLVRQWRVKMG